MMLTRKNNYGFDLFDDFFRDPFFSTNYDRTQSSLMKTDIQEKEDCYLLDIELPGYQKEDVQAQLKDGYLTITATHNENTDDKDKDGRFIRRERFTGTCKRSFYVGEQLRQEDIRAGFQNGILRLRVPKEAPKNIEEKPTYIPIE